MFDDSKNIDIEKIISFVQETHCERVTISGGEPFLQTHELRNLINGLNSIGIDDILLYTGFLKEELESRIETDINFILSHIAVLIDGPFVQDLVDDIPLRGSSNQRVWVYKNKYQEEYLCCLKGKKRIDIFEFRDEVHFIGIPFPNHKKLYSKYVRARKGK